MTRSLPISLSPAYQNRMQRFYSDWHASLEEADFDTLSREGRIDYLLFQHHLDYQRRKLELDAKAQARTARFVPFAQTIIDLEEARRRMEPIDPAQAAVRLDELKLQIAQAHKAAEAKSKAKQYIASRAAERIDALRKTLQSWFEFYHGYDPLFTWWTAEPHKAVDQALQEYGAFLREKVAGIKSEDKEIIVGDPIGRERLLSELAHEMIPYTPEELIAIAEQEHAWCEAEMQRASREMGCGDDWHEAIERVKGLHVEPGKQPQMVRDLAVEAIQFVEDHDLVTVPALAREIWRMEMMSPERQKVNPFFLGGEVIIVSFPTHTMPHEQKRMSLRGNNVHFARATVFHELIPGHHLQLFMAERYHAYRRLFRTPFYIEGWALHWEMLLWDMGFARSPEDRIGMLFWRMHRCVRIIFSLNFHLEKLTPQECIDMLIDRVGHERDNATAEVRRSFGDAYPPLYQCAYMLGGLQMRALYQELVGAGKMTARDFHDAVLKENAIPIPILRAALMQLPLTRNFRSNWRFYDL